VTNLGLEGKRVIVTGAAIGLGRAFALAFAAAGARVLAVDVNEAGAKETAALADNHLIGKLQGARRFSNGKMGWA
jgi:NAD(P)-dependent dehydrogenase (short-subunit alcohol dehydrogenase family)